MGNRWLISDTHFSHRRMQAEFKRKDNGSPLRPWPTLEEMDEAMVDNWNKTVKPDDIVYHLGDFSFGGKQNIGKFASRLLGRKTLILGNHDYNAKDYVDYFDVVTGWKELTSHNFTLVMTHAPLYFHSFDYRFEKSCNVHGHLHDLSTGQPYHFSVCVEQPHMNFTPIAVDDVFKLVKAQQENWNPKHVVSNLQT